MAYHSSTNGSDQTKYVLINLVFRHFCAEDAGTYKVTAKNEYGEANVSVSLLVKSKCLSLLAGQK
jgi:hypothetical protein